jgi:hypothetical protein
MNGIIDSNQKIVTNGLVLNYDAAQLRSYPTTGITWTDLSGNSNNGTLTNGPTFSSDNGGTIVFDGTNDSVPTTYGPTFNDFSVIGWFKSTANIGYSRIIDKDYQFGMWIGRNASVPNSWGGGVRYTNFPYGNFITLTDGAWHMIACVRQGSTQTIYGDGSSNNASSTGSTSALSTQVFSISGFTSFAGSIPIIQIYNRALSATEIQQNFNALKSRFGL